MDQRTRFIADHLRDALSITERCDDYGVSRKTGYKWIERYLRQGPAGLEERSRRPRRSPNQTAEAIVTAILAARHRHPSWGGKKLLALLHKRHPRWLVPGRSTACDILKLSAWWVRLGILPEFIEPGRPDQNGRHQRRHRTLKAATTRPAAGRLAAQPRRVNVFREECNHERPHEALDQETPGAGSTPSPRPMPDRRPPLEYPDRFEVRYVSANGGIR